MKFGGLSESVYCLMEADKTSFFIRQAAVPIRAPGIVHHQRKFSFARSLCLKTLQERQDIAVQKITPMPSHGRVSLADQGKVNIRSIAAQRSKCKKSTGIEEHTSISTHTRTAVTPAEGVMTKTGHRLCYQHVTDWMSRSTGRSTAIPRLYCEVQWPFTVCDMRNVNKRHRKLWSPSFVHTHTPERVHLSYCKWI